MASVTAYDGTMLPKHYGTGRPRRIALTEGQRSDYDGARLLFADLPVAKQFSLIKDTMPTGSVMGSHNAQSARVSRHTPKAVIQQDRLSDWIHSATRLKTCSGA